MDQRQKQMVARFVQETDLEEELARDILAGGVIQSALNEIEI